jgi:ribonuclease Z
LVAKVVADGQRAREEAAKTLLRPDAITVVLGGTGGPMPSERSQSCTAVFANGQFLLFDCGDGAARTLEALNLPVARLGVLFLTHYHSDHYADLGEVIERSWLLGRRESLPVYGPEGAAGIVAGFRAAYQLEQGYRVAHHGSEVMPASGARTAVTEFKCPADGGTQPVYENEGVVVRAFAASHQPVAPAVGYRVEYAGKVVVISGDTSRTAALLEQSKGADLLVADAMNKQVIEQVEAANRAVGQAATAAIMHDIREYHMDVREVGALAREAGVKRLALTHLTPPVDMRAQVSRFFTAPAAEEFKGEIVAGADGTRIVIPLG